MCWLVLLVLLVGLTELNFSQEIKCGPNQIYARCVNTCPLNCSNYRTPPRICSLICREGCDCVKGYVWYNGQCIPIAKCPRIGEPPVRCAGNRTFKSVNIRVTTCDGITTFPWSPGCYCKDDYLLDEVSGRCVLERDCPKTKKELHCPVNEIKSKCANPCPPTCQDKNLFGCPFLTCEAGCLCKPGYLRDKISGYCVHPTDCPAKEPWCSDPHEEYKECGSACPPTCIRPHRYCTLQCVEGCFCISGYIRGSNGTCILAGKCWLRFFELRK